MATYYGYLRRMGAFGSRNTANPASPSFVAAPPPPAKPAPFVMGQGMDPGVRTASPSPGGGFRQALSQAARAIVAAGAAGPSPGGLYRQAVARTTQARAMALAGAARIPPSYSGNPFVLARPGDGFGSGGAGPSPGGQYRQAIEQGARALLGALTAPGGAAPGGQYRQALSRSARAVTAAKAAANAARSLLFTGYDLPSRRDATTDAAAASLADRLGFGRYVSGRERIGWPPRGRGGAANAGSMMDAASRILAARSRGRNAAAAGAARNSLMLGGSAGGRYDPSLMPQSPWAGVPPSLAADGYGPYRGLTTRRSRWLDFPRTKFPNSTLPESGADFRAMIAMQEHPDIKNEYDLHTRYDDDRTGKGLYQLTRSESQQIGATDAEGNWNPEYYPGIDSEADFLANPVAQERIFHDMMRDYDHQLRSNRAYDFLGENIVGLKDAITVTDAGLLAAAHRQGAKKVRQYLQRQKENGWDTRKWIRQLEWVAPSEADKLMAVETRMRLFQDVPYN